MTKADLRRYVKELVSRRKALRIDALRYVYDLGVLAVDLTTNRPAIKHVYELAEDLQIDTMRIHQGVILARSLRPRELEFFERRAWPVSLVALAMGLKKPSLGRIKKKYAKVTYPDVAALRAELQALILEQRASTPRKDKKKKKK